MKAGAFRRGASYILDDMIVSIWEMIVVIFNSNSINQMVIDLTYQTDMTNIWEFYKIMFQLMSPWIGTAMLGSLIIAIPYYIILPVRWNGQTVGRKVVGVQVVSTKADKLTYSQMALRELVGKSIWWLVTLGLGIIIDWIMIVARKDKKALRDILFHTEVVMVEGEFVKEEYYDF